MSNEEVGAYVLRDMSHPARVLAPVNRWDALRRCAEWQHLLIACTPQLAAGSLSGAP